MTDNWKQPNVCESWTGQIMDNVHGKQQADVSKNEVTLSCWQENAPRCPIKKQARAEQRAQYDPFVNENMEGSTFEGD